MSQPIVRRTRLPGKTWERENIDDRLDIVVGRHILRWTKPLARENFRSKMPSHEDVCDGAISFLPRFVKRSKRPGRLNPGKNGNGW